MRIAQASLVLSLTALHTTQAYAANLVAKNIDWRAYERGEFGPYPQAKFHSVEDITAPLVHANQTSEECDNSSLTLLSPFGEGIPGNKLFLLDARGELVYYKQERGTVRNVQVQSYKGIKYLTYWVGDDDFASHGAGYYKMLDQSYSLAYTISALNGLDGDFHEFSITPDDTAIISAYVKRPWNLVAFGQRNGYIWDCAFQEIDIATNQVLFEWRASDHFHFSDMAVNSWEDWTGNDLHPWDWFHLNSVEKDPWGNFLISARYTNAITYLDGTTGNLLWHLGGENSTFSSPFQKGSRALINPHSARWTDRYSAITLFQNAGSVVTNTNTQTMPYAMKIKLDYVGQHAEVVSRFVLPESLGSLSEGSVQALDNGNYFVSYGPASIFAEFARNGSLLCSTHYSPVENGESSDMKHGQGQSYRIYKHQWQGQPTQPPNVAFHGSQIYASWNGATELRSWKLEGSVAVGPNVKSWEKLGSFKTAGFETAIPLSQPSFSSYRLTALDSKGYALRSWVLSPTGDLWEVFNVGLPFDRPSSRTLAITIIFLSSALLVLLNRRCLPKLNYIRGHRYQRLSVG